VSAGQVGKYRLLRVLAAGGMGEVFLARQEGPAGFQKPAVVKRILSHLAREPSFVEMFLNEARLAALLAHPNVVQIFELGEADGTYFIAMEFIHGRTLRAVMQKLRAKNRLFPPAHLARICGQALMGLHYAHTLRGESGESLHIVHRDMSPDNIMVGFNGTVKVLDFGIAKVATSMPTTQTGTVKGKFAYMSPEQVTAQAVDGRADQWSVGVILYELLAGARPFVAPVDAALVNLILNTDAAPLRERNPQVPAALAEVVERALRKNPQDRFASAEEMALALERVAAQENVALTNGETQGFMRELFGDEALENPAVLTPTGPLPLLPSEDVSLATKTSTPSKAPRRGGAVLALTGLAFALIGAAVGFMLLKPEPKPLPVREAPKPVAVVDAGAHAAVVDAGAEPVKVVEPAPVVDAGAPAAVKPVPRGSGKLDLRVNPWAEVFEGKKSLGITPMPPLELSAGVHQLTLKNSELKVSRSITVKVPKGGTVVQRIDLLE
jgi:serine/threonine protein kinase